MTTRMTPGRDCKRGGLVQQLSAGQQGLYFLHKAAPESRAYNLACAAMLRADTDLTLLKKAIRTVFERHEAWRTRIVAKGESPELQIHAGKEFITEELDGSTWSREELSGRIVDHAMRPFDLASDILCRTCLITRSDQNPILLLAAHHIALDGWSLWVCVNEICALYKGHRNGAPTPLEPPKAEYTDFVGWQKSTLSGPRAEHLWDYWRDELAGDLPVLNLPVDRPHPAVQPYHGAAHSFEIGPEQTERLSALAKQEGTTLYTLLLAAYQTLLHRYSNQETILVGSPTAGRGRRDFRGTIGYFVNSVVMRGDFGGDPRFRDFLNTMHHTVRSALRHQDYPFPLLLEKLEIDRDPSRSPLFQSSFVFQKPGDLGRLAELVDVSCAERPFDVDGLNLGPLTILQREDQYDLALEMASLRPTSRSGETIPGVFKYRADLFDASTVKRMVRHFVRLLDEIVDHPEKKISSLRLLTDDEEKLIIEDWNATRVPPADALCIHQLFERQAEQSPDATAIASESGNLTYGQLNRRANRLAHHLRERGVGPEKLVGLLVDRSAEAMVGLLGILKAGGAYLPLDPAFPAARLKFMLEGADISLVVTRDFLKDALRAVETPIVDLDSDAEAIARQSEENPVCDMGQENLLYVIFTSGSSGKPKGVAMPHRAIANLIAWQLDNTSIAHPARTLQFASLSFDVSIQEIFTAWCSGGTLVLVKNEIRHDMERLASFIADEGIERIFVPFVALQQLSEVFSDRGTEDLKLREVITAGEQLQITPAVASLFDRLQECALCNQYGPTESHVATAFRLPENRSAWPILPPIGRPLANMEIFILNATRQPVPIGVAGELHIGGAGLARGYVNRPALTAKQFVAHPFTAERGARLYRTGDLARYRHDGTIEFLGRSDFQVKVRGYRIELGEIETILCRHEALREATVVLREDGSGRKRLAAYLVAKDGAEPGARELRDFVKQHLPPYMVPATYTLLEALPLTPGGKIDRRALPAPEITPHWADEEYEPPRTQTEELIAKIWSTVLGVERIGRTDNFFELGGHSLLATQVASRVRDVLGVEAPLRDFFETPTVEGLAARYDSEHKNRLSTGLASPIEKAVRADAMPLSFSQERMWFLHQLDPESAAYNMGVAFRLEGLLDRDAAERALREIIRRHENLRTTFHSAENGPVSRIAADVDLHVHFVKLNDLPEPERIAGARERAGAEIREPFDLAAGPLFRATVYELDNEDHVILFCMHHIVSDLWTFGVLFDELSRLYRAECGKTVSPLPAPALQYADFAVWQREWFQGTVLDEQLSFWKKQLTGVRLLELPIDFARPAVRTTNGGLKSMELPPRLIADLKLFAAREGATPFMVLLALFKLLLMRITGQTDVVVGTPIANRNRLAVEEMTGTFVNTLAMRTDLEGDPTFSDLLGRIKETTLSAYAHQDMPFEKLVEQLQPERDMSHSPLVQVLFNLANAPFETPRIDDLAWSPLEVDRGSAQFDLSLFVDLEISRKAYAEFNTDLFEPDTIARLLGHYRIALESILENPAQPLSSVPLLSADEQNRLLEEWNATSTAYSSEICLPQLIETQAARRTDRVAVRLNGDRLTYGELNKRSNQVARRLREMGARPGVFVGIYMERSLDMIVGLLGVLKSGAAYLPLDPAFPRDRLEFMIDDAAVPILLTEERLVADLAGPRTATLAIDSEWDSLSTLDADNLEPMARPDDLAYVIYTSGSTGKPKGVQISHRALVNFLESMRAEPGLVEEDRVLALTTLSFDIATLELYVPLIVGAQVDLVDRETAYDSALLAKKIAASDATVIQATPATWRMLIDSGWEGKEDLKILCGGEALARDLADALLVRCASLWNMYGPTETTVWSAICEVEPGNDSILIGRPIANTEIYLLDDRLQPVPVGVPGELHIGGDGLARGYLNREELTEEKFIPHPFRPDGGARIYKTGDLARYRPDGRIECLGRIDNQVKIRGFRVELGEIETAIVAHPAVRKAVVVVREDTPGDRRLVAYVVPDNNHEPTLAELRPFLRESLPDYMVPSAVVALKSFPLTPNGKVDRRALGPPEQGRPEQVREYQAPRTPLEKTLVKVWSDVLAIDRIGINDDFFDLGGHSLLATRLANALRQTLDIDLPLRAIFLESTVANMARKITYTAKTGAYAYHETPPKWASLVPIQPKGERRPFFLVSGNYREEDEFYGYMANLVPHLGLDQPVFGFRARGLDGRQDPHRTAEEMARDYVDEMRLYQPEGPYLLGGECVGGVVAFEMAQRLMKDGHDVGLLLLMDTVRPSWYSAFLVKFYFLQRKVLSISNNLRRIFQPDHQKGKEHLTRLIQRKRRLYFPLNEDERIRKRIYNIEMAYSKLMFRYRPRPFPGKLTLLVNEEQYGRDSFIGWKGYAEGGVARHRVPGNHLTRITEYVKITAARLRACLDDAQGSGDTKGSA